MNNNSALRSALAIISFLFLSLVIKYYNKSSVTQQQQQHHLRIAAHNNPSVNAQSDAFSLSNNDHLTLLPGDLPGYTGWYRPSTTIAQYFEIIGVDDPSTIKFGEQQQNWTVTVKCNHPIECPRDGGSMFYVRAYGPSILPGVVTDHRNGTYTVSVMPFDYGIYQLEVVLAFSNPPSLDLLPTEHEIAYEGYLLPGFPMQVQFFPTSTTTDDEESSSSGINSLVAPAPSSNNNRHKRRLCRISDMVETGTRSAVETGRWLITDKVMSMSSSKQHQYYSRVDTLPSDDNHNNTTNINSSLNVVSPFIGYQSGLNSLGFQADYFYNECKLIPETIVKQAKTLFKLLEFKRDILPPRQLRVLFIGDSNMRVQQKYFDTYFGGSLRTELISNYNGIVPTLSQIKQRLNELKQEKENAIYFILFNTGLHDIDKLCTNMRKPFRAEYITVPDANFSCFQQYQTTLREFVNVVVDFSTDTQAPLTIWQTTSAGWPKWGVYGASWPPNIQQVLPLSTNAVEYLNQIAYDIVVKHAPQIQIMDAYWISYSRPDNREIDYVNKLTRHLVHPGLEVLSVLTRKWAMMILQILHEWK